MVFFANSAVLALAALCAAPKVGAHSWDNLPETLPKPLSDMTATLIPAEMNNGDDIIYIAGGCSSEKGNENVGGNDFYCLEVTNEMYAFNVKTKTFAKMKNMPEPRYRHAAVEIYGKLYIVGGRDVEDNLVAAINVYDPTTDNWSELRTLPESAQVSDNAALTYEGKLYVLGGYNKDYDAQGSLIEIDLQTTGIISKQDMITPRGDANAVSYEFADGKVIAYIMGGFTSANNFCAPLADAEQYDFITDTWTLIPKMNFKRGDKSVVVHEDKVFAIGGEAKDADKCNADYVEPSDEVGSGSILVDDVEYYDPREEDPIWKFEQALDEHRFRAAAVAVKSTDSVYVFGGQSLYSDTCNCYPTSDTIFEYVEGNHAHGDGSNSHSHSSSDDHTDTSAAMKPTTHASTFVALLSFAAIVLTAY